MTETPRVEFIPSQVDLSPIPLVGTFNHSEAEGAAVLLIRAMVEHGDRWQPIGPKQVGATMKADLEDEASTVHALKDNPFWRPDDFDNLVKDGFARLTEPALEKGSPIEFTEKGLARLLEKNQVLCGVLGPQDLKCERRIGHKIKKHAGVVEWEAT